MPDDPKTVEIDPTGLPPPEVVDEPEEIDPAKTSESQEAWQGFINSTRDTSPPPAAEEKADKTV